MENILKRGLCLIGIYAFAILLVFLTGDRITKLEQNSDFRNTNGSVSIVKNK